MGNREKAVQFFYDHAGWGYNPATETEEQGRQRHAEELADAEQAAKRAGVWYVWEPDQEVDERDELSTTEHTCEWVALYIAPEDVHDRPRMLASLGGIWDASAEYRRVVEAELASEALSEIEAIINREIEE